VIFVLIAVGKKLLYRRCKAAAKPELPASGSLNFR